MITSGTKSPKTTIFGIITAIALLIPEILKVFDDSPETGFNMEMVIPALAAAGIGFFARDHNVSSKASGVEK